MSFRESRLPEFAGLRLDADPAHMAAVVADNVEFRKAVEVSKRPGFRRVNQVHYAGSIICLPDVQRICDYGKYLVFADNVVYEHDNPNYTPPVDPFFDPAYGPVAVATGAPLTGVPPLAVQFSSAGSWSPDGGPLAYSWDFGDGAISNLPNPTHVYAASGTFNAVLTVSAGGKSASAGVSVTVVGPVQWDGVGPGIWKAGP
jgi:hypothetical protein